MIGVLFLVITALFGVKTQVLQVGTVVKTAGDRAVFLSRAWGVKHHRVNEPDRLYNDDDLTTGKRSKAYVTLIDGSRLAVGEASHLKVRSIGMIEHVSGEAEYDIRPRHQIKLEVVTDFAIIRVKGTRFWFSDRPRNKRLSLDEGDLVLEARKNPFVLFVHDPNCADQGRVVKTMRIGLRAGEGLIFEDNGHVYKTCRAPGALADRAQELPGSVVLSYGLESGKRYCESSVQSLEIGQPRLIATEAIGCGFEVDGFDKTCQEIARHNVQSADFTRTEKGARFTFRPLYSSSPAFTQFVCR